MGEAGAAVNIPLLVAAIAAEAEAPRRADPGDDTPPDLVPIRWDDAHGELVNVRVTGLDLPEIDLGSFAPSGPMNRAQRRAEKHRVRTHRRRFA